MPPIERRNAHDAILSIASLARTLHYITLGSPVYVRSMCPQFLRTGTAVIMAFVTPPQCLPKRIPDRGGYVQNTVDGCYIAPTKNCTRQQKYAGPHGPPGPSPLGLCIFFGGWWCTIDVVGLIRSPTGNQLFRPPFSVFLSRTDQSINTLCFRLGLFRDESNCCCCKINNTIMAGRIG